MLGAVCRQFRAVSAAATSSWVGCVRAMWCFLTFSNLRRVAEPRLLEYLTGIVSDDDFAWMPFSICGSGGHRTFQFDRSEPPTAPHANQAHAIQLIQEVDQDLKRDAVIGRAAALHGDLTPHRALVEAGKARLRAALRDLLELRLPTCFPSGWVEAQLFAAVWLTAFQCIDELLSSVDCFPFDPGQIHAREVIRGLTDVWDHVHNGVNSAYWTRMRAMPREMRKEYHMRFARIWRMARPDEQTEREPEHGGANHLGGRSRFLWLA